MESKKRRKRLYRNTRKKIFVKAESSFLKQTSITAGSAQRCIIHTDAWEITFNSVAMIITNFTNSKKSLANAIEKIAVSLTVGTDSFIQIGGIP